MKMIIQRAEALRQGLGRYFTGAPCARGHVEERLTSNYGCLACLREKAAGWRSENPEKAKARDAASYARNREAKVEASRRWKAENREAVRAYAKRYHVKNKDRIREKDAARWIREGSETSERAKKWRAANKVRLRELDSARRARLAGAIPADFGELDALVIEEAFLACRRREARHGEAFEVDHIIPITRGGHHAWYNVQVIPARLNRKKGNRLWLLTPGEWVKHV